MPINLIGGHKLLWTTDLKGGTGDECPMLFANETFVAHRASLFHNISPHNNGVLVFEVPDVFQTRTLFFRMFYTDSGHYVLPFVLEGDNIDPDKEDQELRQAVSAHVPRLIHSNKVTTDTTVVFHSTSEAGSGSIITTEGLPSENCSASARAVQQQGSIITTEGLPSESYSASQAPGLTNEGLPSNKNPSSVHVSVKDGLPSLDTRNTSLGYEGLPSVLQNINCLATPSPDNQQITEVSVEKGLSNST